MPIGNQEIWDKGIGAGATNVIFGGGDTQPSATNFNPGALGADPNAQPAADTATPETTTTTPPPTTPAQPVEPKGPHPNVVAAKNKFDMAQMKYQQALQVLSGKGSQAHYSGMTLSQWLRQFHDAQARYLQMQQQYP